MVTRRDLCRVAWLLVLFSPSLRLPAQVLAEDIGHEFIPPEHWSYPALARFEALGLCRLPSERPYSRDDVILYTEEIVSRVAERGATLSPRDEFNLERLQKEFAGAESRANPKTRFDRPLLFASDGPMHLEGDLDLALVPDKPPHREEWDFFGVAHPVLRLHLGRSFTYDFRYRLVMGPERDGRERNERPSPRERSFRGLTSIYERSYLVYHWKQGTVFFGRDYADWGPAENRNVILSQEAGSLDKLGGRLQFKSLRLSVIHSILSSPDDRYLSGHRLEGAFGRVTVGLSETVIHRDRFLDPVYMLPFSSFYANQFNERSDDNVMWGVDVKVRVLDGATVDGSLLIDDFQYERGDSTPDMLAFNVGVRTDVARPLPLTLRARYRYVDIYTYTHRDSTKAHVTGSGDPNNGDPLLGVAEGPDTDLLTASADCFPLPRLTATALFSFLRRGEGNDFRAFHPGDDHAPPFPSGVVERTTSFGLALAWEFDGNSLARAEFVRSRVENEGHVPGADEWRNAVRVVLRWNL
ncbi:MAG: hypothetical protein OEO21_04525 [Candidatus Krumholzibacteria bacterium]|nr:hypothetical protein [Candidatus Krumholzibacteria bacterium]